MDALGNHLPILILCGITFICIIVYVGFNIYNIRMQKQRLAHWEQEVKASDERIQQLMEKIQSNKNDLIQSLSNIDAMLDPKETQDHDSEKKD